MSENVTYIYVSQVFAGCISSVLCAGNVSKISTFLCTGNVPEMSPVLCYNVLIYATYPGHRKCTWNFMCSGQEICLKWQVSWLHKMCLKFHVYWLQEMYLKFCLILSKKCERNADVGQIHSMNRKCQLSCIFHEISWPRKFRISSSVMVETIYNISVMS